MIQISYSSYNTIQSDSSVQVILVLSLGRQSIQLISRRNGANSRSSLAVYYYDVHTSAHQYLFGVSGARSWGRKFMFQAPRLLALYGGNVLPFFCADLLGTRPSTIKYHVIFLLSLIVLLPIPSSQDMYTSNPYAQGGWPNPANRNSVNNELSNLPQPSIFGALPFAKPPSPPKFLTFRFTSFNPNILNCTVLGPKNRPYFQVLNDTPTPGITLLQSMDGQGVAIIEWRQAPIIEVRNIIQRRLVAQWIGLSQDRACVIMYIRIHSWILIPVTLLATERWKQGTRCIRGFHTIMSSV